MLDAKMPDKPSKEANSLSKAQSIVRKKIHQFFLLQINYTELKKGIQIASKIAGKTYSKQVITFANLYMRQYIYGTFGVSFAALLTFFRRTPSAKLCDCPLVSRYFKTGAEDAEVLSEEYMNRLRKATAEILENSKLSLGGFISDAEAQSLYDRQMEEVENLKNLGVKLVVCSSHADCSNLCLPYQGKVYSLDGSRGTTADGRSYIPLEEATGPTKLFHKWCKHRVVPYHQGMMEPHLSAEENKKEVSITNKQRYLERYCRRVNLMRESWEGIDNKKYSYYTQKYNDGVDRYYKYCGENGRAPIRYRLR